MSLKKLLTVIYFQIGVNVIGLPDFISHEVNIYTKAPKGFSKYF